MSVIQVKDEANLQGLFSSAGSKLVVIAFSATWCGPCRTVAPQYTALSKKYLNVVFLKVDIDECDAIATRYNITSVPTFIFFINGIKKDVVKGINVEQIEEKVIKFSQASGSSSDSGNSYAPHMDLTPLIAKPGCECLNESDDHPLSNCLEPHRGTYLESDCDEQLIITLGFNQPIKLHSLKIVAPKDQGPKTLKLFINQPNSLDFDRASSSEPVQTLNLTPGDIADDASPIQLKYVKFQNVNSLTIFVKDNQEGTETTRIKRIIPIGSTAASTNMNDFKRVGGKQGEAH